MEILHCYFRNEIIAPFPDCFLNADDVWTDMGQKNPVMLSFVHVLLAHPGLL